MMFLLAQKYEAASGLTSYLFESPGAPAGALFMLALILVIASFKIYVPKVKKIILISAVVSFVLSIVIVGIAQQVTTTHEIVQKEMEKFVKAANAPLDETYLDSRLHESFEAKIQAVRYNRKSVIDRIRSYSSRIREGRIGILDNKAYVKSPTEAKTVIKIRADQDNNELSIPYAPRFEIYWQKVGEQWQIISGRHLKMTEPPTDD